MPKQIIARVDHSGDVSVEFSGFVNRECEAEAKRLRRHLVELGLESTTELFRPVQDQARVDAGGNSSAKNICNNS